jgi:acyl-CoA reductase-like NAD-dependent aldehyde dehydrogenase
LSGTGKRINASAAPDMKRVTLECGGNDAAIVRADADVAAAAKGVIGSAFANSGQVRVQAVGVM